MEKNLFSTGNIHFQPGIMNFQVEIIFRLPAKMLRQAAAINFPIAMEVFSDGNPYSPFRGLGGKLTFSAYLCHP